MKYILDLFRNLICLLKFDRKVAQKPSIFLSKANFKKGLLPILLCTLPLLQAEAPFTASTVSSTEANYNGESLQLTGDVKITHELATMTAERANIKKHEEKQDQPLSTITLEQSVHLLFPHKDTEVSCHLAHIDFNTLSAAFEGSTKDPIVYTDTLNPKDSIEPLPIHMTSKQLDVHFFETQTSAQKKQYAVDTLHAKEAVRLKYGNAWTLLTERADYQRPQKAATPSLNGLFVATSTDSNHPCVLCYGEDHQIVSSTIAANLETSKLNFEYPKGSLPAYFSPESTLTFHANTLDWDQANDHLLMAGNVHIEDPSFGILDTKDGIDLKLDRSQKQPMQSLRTTGPANLTYIDAHKITHIVKSESPICADHLLNQVQTEQADSKIRYENGDFSIIADRALIQYQEEAGKVVPSTLHLSGNVRLISTDPEKPKKLGLANTLLYSFKERTATLSAKAGEKVLVKEEDGGMQLAAPQVRITSEAGEPQVQGIGAVRFSFTPDEESKFKTFIIDAEKKP